MYCCYPLLFLPRSIEAVSVSFRGVQGTWDHSFRTCQCHRVHDRSNFTEKSLKIDLFLLRSHRCLSGSLVDTIRIGDWVPIRSIPSCSFCCHSISVAVDWGLVKKSWSRSRLPPRHRDLRKNHPCPNNKLNQENKISHAFCIKIYFNIFFVLQTLPSVWCPGQDMPLQAKGLAPLWMLSLSQLLAIWIPWHLPPLMWAVNFEKTMIVMFFSRDC